MKIYLDHNILDEISKNRMTLEAPDDTVWVYSDESFNEIKRAKNMRFLDVLKNLKARKLELELDNQFRLTGRAFLHDYCEPKDMYQQWLDNISEINIDELMQSQMQFLARLAGADNHNEILHQPHKLKEFLYAHLSPDGSATKDIELQIERAVAGIESVVCGKLQEVESLEASRTAIGTGRGRASNLSIKDNPLLLMWEMLRVNYKGMTIEQFYGFEPLDKQGYERWPLYLGVVGCHTVLNFLGFHPDKGLNRIEKIPAILSDANHTAMAIYCDAILSKDQRFCAKARAIFAFLDLDIMVIEATPNDKALSN
ncbi:hypothetical protein BSY44_02590 [Salmonella enterica subsp. enterica serovar Paratyphi B]|uniref:Uncharacterized protein n=1 Tax=Salmonella enterica subsp. enterica serovar Java TaxID=224729 RepID=A0A5V7YV06_SALEB|nr:MULTISPECIES: hypothetical protein [Enterobacteriaceae]EAA3946127.1 hypothetical protein [Salmonella enterica subsp. enterica serovar Java]EAA6049120.1 hypothetical protein [Salmonella enterica subsp. enterica serovar Newport]EAA6951969.1 hypothetical protein [Salmonella enterica subsp. enterica serovar Stanley]EAB4593696.1 hypothetical protein [Salmonella enterica]EBG7987334.1 hypothetical protein [Salmonella enterica subsp. enterica serovar Agona]EBL5912338.1 hypothetical protein [Salmon